MLENIARGGTMQVVYTCVETLETPAIARVLASDSFQAQLSGIYIDEAHSIHESISWRPGYSRIHLLRRLIGMDSPLVGLSATLPKVYQDALEDYAGLRPDYYLINLGNFRPELSTIILHMKHPASSFLDLAFVIPFNATAESLKNTIIYSDDLDMLTAMYWWGRTRLGAINLPVDLIDILHAGLSDTHQTICTADFIAGKTKILLGSDKIGAGMDFPNVTLVVQYRCRGLTVVKWEQRRGRGARRDGMTATSVLMAEKSMAGTEKDSPTVKSPKSEDPGIVELVQSPGTSSCCESITDSRLENPRRPASRIPCGRCSNCNPHLRVENQYTFIMEDLQPHKTAPRGKISDTQKNEIFDRLVAWRLKIWRDEWMDGWPSYGPESLVSDHDLREITQKARAVTSIDDLDAIARIPHLDQLATSLLTTLESVLREVCGFEPTPLEPPTTEVQQHPQVQLPFRSIGWANPESPATIAASEVESDTRRKQGNLSQGEFVIKFL